MDVHLRGIDPDVWRWLRLASVDQRTTVARVIEALARPRMSDDPTILRLALERLGEKE